jgi:2-dehydropantoate 2-reductase
MRILVVGAGAMGCLFAARLKMAGNDVILFEIVEEWADKINRRGIKVEGVTGEYGVQVHAFSKTIPSSPDLVLMCVKSYDTRSAAEAIRLLLRPDTAVLTLQNGLGNVETLTQILEGSKVLGGITSEGATVLAPGKIRHAGRGETLIGAEKEKRTLVESIVLVFRGAGFACSSVENVQSLIWGKLIINVGINALTAITRLRNGRLPQFKGTRLILEQAVLEAVAVATAKNVELPYPDPVARTLKICQATSENVSSMLQDVLKKRTTEIESINGAIVREGKTLSIPTPVNLTLTSLVQSIQESYRESISTLDSR